MTTLETQAAERRDRVVALYQAGLCSTEIAAIEGVCRQTVRSHLRAARVEDRDVKAREIRVAQIRAAHGKLSVAQAASQFEVAQTTIRVYWRGLSDALLVPNDAARRVEGIVRWRVNDTFISLPRVLGIEQVSL